MSAIITRPGALIVLPANSPKGFTDTSRCRTCARQKTYELSVETRRMIGIGFSRNAVLVARRPTTSRSISCPAASGVVGYPQPSCGGDTVNWEEVGAIGQVLGSLAVFVTLV